MHKTNSQIAVRCPDAKAPGGIHFLAKRVWTIALLLCASVALSGCFASGGQTSYLRDNDVKLAGAGKRVLLMPTDVELSLLTAGGIEEPKAEWTVKAKGNITPALRDILKTDNISIIQYRGQDVAKQHVQLVKLHDAVGRTILLSKYTRRMPLLTKTKENAFDWSLGHNVSLLRTKYRADYALFVFVRDSYASGGRKALVFMSSLLGGNTRGGTQVGFASLVDLRTGKLVWFNVMGRESGDLRTADGAKETMGVLLAGLPK